MSQEVKMIVGIAAVTIAIFVGAVVFLGKSTSQSPNLSATPLPSDFAAKLVRPDSHMTATESAKVMMVEFGDYQCPACGREYPIIKKVVTDYQGKLALVFRNFPLPMHQNALVAAEAAEAAGVQGKYWEMHDWLYEHQNEWADSNNPIDQFAQAAQGLGLDSSKLKTDILTNAYQTRIKEDQNDGNALGINATPTLYINGQQVGGLTLPSEQDLRTIIDKDLKS